MRFVCREHLDELSGDFHRIQLRLRKPRREIIIFDFIGIFHIGRSHFRLVPGTGGASDLRHHSHRYKAKTNGFHIESVLMYSLMGLSLSDSTFGV